jgi:hypothetical protein
MTSVHSLTVAPFGPMACSAEAAELQRVRKLRRFEIEAKRCQPCDVRGVAEHRFGKNGCRSLVVAKRRQSRNGLVEEICIARPARK